jgi:thioredoxin reductase
MNKRTNLLIIGAGPFGLALAVYVKHLGVEHLIVGKPGEFPKSDVPDDMLLRSASDWPLDPTDRATVDKYLKSIGQTPAALEPLSQDFYLAYCQWFQEQIGVQCLPFHVTKLEQVNGAFEAQLANGEAIEAQQVVIAVSKEYFRDLPLELTDLLPKGRFKHTGEAVQLKRLKRKRVLILGDRQSAFEWTALLKDKGAAEVRLVHRPASPRFAKSELKVKPWLEKRIMKNDTHIHIHAMTKLVSCTERADGALDIGLDNGESFIVDEVILATGYKVDLGRIPFLQEGNLLEKIWVQDGFPVLDDQFQTTVKGLYLAGSPSTRDPGPFFGSSVSVRTSAKMIGSAIANPQNEPGSIIYEY